MKTEFTFTLTSPVTYKPDNSGEQSETSTLTLKAPTNKQRTQRNKLKQYVLQSMFERQEKIQDSESLKNLQDEVDTDKLKKAEDMTDEEIERQGEILVMSLYGSKMVDSNVLIEEFLVLLQQVCFLEKDKNITKPVFEKMTPDDTDRLLGAYLVNFIRLS